jgi:hypothetical protein
MRAAKVAAMRNGTVFLAWVANNHSNPIAAGFTAHNRHLKRPRAVSRAGNFQRVLC